MPSYRFTGEAPEVFPDVVYFDDDGQPHTLEAEPGREFDAERDVVHPRIERLVGGKWEPTISDGSGWGTVAEVLEAVGTDRAKAAAALEAERGRGAKARKTLVADLEEIIGTDDPAGT